MKEWREKREREGGRQILTREPPTKNKKFFFPFVLRLFSSPRPSLTTRFFRVPSGQTLFLDIHPQKCNDRLFSAVKLYIYQRARNLSKSLDDDTVSLEITQEQGESRR